MADTGKFGLTTHDGDGSTTSFAIGFPFLDIGHLVVKVGGVEQHDPTDWTLDSASANIQFTVAPGSGSGNVTFQRVTPHSTVLTFADNVVVSATLLDRMHKQLQYIAEEGEETI